MARQRTLTPLIKVRILVPQPGKKRVLAESVKILFAFKDFPRNTHKAMISTG